jgi:hypothetical protein
MPAVVPGHVEGHGVFFPAAGASKRRWRALHILCDVAHGRIWPVIQEADRAAVFETIHGLAHPGMRAKRRLLSSTVVWRGMSTDITAWCRDCQACQAAKIAKQPKVKIQPIPVPAVRFTHVQVDIVGRLPTSAEGYQNLFTMVDRSTRWLEAVPLRSMDTTTCLDALLGTWVARFGVPSTLTSDQGRQFTSAVWASMCTVFVQAARRAAHHHHRLPSPVQWYGGADTQAAEGCPTGKAGGRTLARAPGLLKNRSTGLNGNILRVRNVIYLFLNVTPM